MIAQPLPDKTPNPITLLLAKNGYENLRVKQRNDTIFIGLENRVWRWETRAVADVLKLVMPLAGPGGTIALTLQREGIAVTTITVPRRLYEGLLSGSISQEGFTDSVSARLAVRDHRSPLAHIRAANRSFNKLDVVVYPQLKMQFGDFVHPLEVQFNVAPAVQINFLKGMSATAQVIFPVFNNLVGDPQGNTIRPGLVVLSQSFHLPAQIFATVSAGYFTRDRYGFNGEARKFLFNGKMSVGASLGYTGRMQLLEGKFTYTPIDALTWFCDASWRFARYDLMVHGGYGGFIAGDKGWRFDVTRRFGEVSIGFFAMKTGGLINGGFNFIIPLPPRKLGTKNHIRIRPAPYVPWEYRAKGLPSYGRMFSTGDGTEELMFNMNPDYIRTALGKQILKTR
jgi:hypothetical protein